jgi:hypothetical protein
VGDLDRKLFACHRGGPYAEAEWLEMLHHVVGALEVFLEQPVKVTDMSFFLDGFAGDISSPQPFAGRLRLEWFGRIGVTAVGHRAATVCDARIFLRAAGKRLIAGDGHALLYLHYLEHSPGQYGWSPIEWDRDEYGEFEHWK